jgi:hypothetical protein
LNKEHKRSVKEIFIDIDFAFYLVPQPSALIEKYEAVKKKWQ